MRSSTESHTFSLKLNRNRGKRRQIRLQMPDHEARKEKSARNQVADDGEPDPMLATHGIPNRNPRIDCDLDKQGQRNSAQLFSKAFGKLLVLESLPRQNSEIDQLTIASNNF